MGKRISDLETAAALSDGDLLLEEQEGQAVSVPLSLLRSYAASEEGENG